MKCVLIRIRSRLLLALMAIALAFHAGLPASAVELTGQAVVDAIQQAKVLPGGSRAMVSGTGKNKLVSVTTTRNEHGTVEQQQKDCKVNSLLVGKALMDKWPVIATVRLLFWDRRISTCWTIDVHQADIGYFGLGEIDQEKLLTSLILQQSANTVRTSSAPAVAFTVIQDYTPVKGHNREERMKIWENIVAIGKMELPMAADPWNDFMKLEGRVQKGEGDATDMQTQELSDRVLKVARGVQVDFLKKKEQMDLNRAQEEGRSNSGNLPVSYGYRYTARFKIAKAIDRLAGIDPAGAHTLQAYYYNNLEPAVKRTDNALVDHCVLDLQTQLHLPPE